MTYDDEIEGFASLYDMALDADVAVDELAEFADHAVHCHVCGSYYVSPIRRQTKEGVVRIAHHRCDECGAKIRKVRGEELRGKTFNGFDWR